MQVRQETSQPEARARVYWPVVLSGVLGVAISVSMFVAVRTYEEQQAKTEFVRAAQERTVAFERELLYCIAELEQFGGFFAGSEEVTRPEFHEYAKRLGRGYVRDWVVQWVPRVLPSERAGFESSERERGVPGFTIHPADGNADVDAGAPAAYFPVQFVQPDEKQQELLGLDLGSIPAELRALSRAMDSGGIAISRCSRSNERPSEGPGIMVVVPVYRPGTPIELPKDRRHNLQGFIVGRFRLKALLDRAVGPFSERGMAVTIQLPPQRLPEDQTPDRKPDQASQAIVSAAVEGRAEFSHQATINVGDRRLEVTCFALPTYNWGAGGWNQWLLPLLGLFLTAMIVSYLHGKAVHARGLLALNRKLTEEIQHCQRVEAELARHQSHLEDLVAERSRQLEESRATLVQTERLASIGTLAAGIAHEINNPVGTMMLAAENALELREKPGTGATVTDCLKGIVAEARRCGDVIHSVLQFARREETQKWPVPVETILQRSLELTEIYSRQHAATVSLEVPAGLPLLMANSLQMEQVFVNLIRNAVETGRKGVRVVIRAQTQGKRMRITISDDGPGIPEEHLPRVFDPFFTTRLEQGGTGLGLSIVHGIIAEHNGTISVESRVGGGTMFIIDLPVVLKEDAEVPDGQAADR